MNLFQSRAANANSGEAASYTCTETSFKPESSGVHTKRRQFRNKQLNSYEAGDQKTTAKLQIKTRISKRRPKVSKKTFLKKSLILNPNKQVYARHNRLELPTLSRTDQDMNICRLEISSSKTERADDSLFYSDDSMLDQLFCPEQHENGFLGAFPEEESCQEEPEYFGSTTIAPNQTQLHGILLNPLDLFKGRGQRRATAEQSFIQTAEDSTIDLVSQEEPESSGDSQSILSFDDLIESSPFKTTSRLD